MTKPTLPPAPFDIPPAPIARDRASARSVTKEIDLRLALFAWHPGKVKTYHQPPDDRATDVFDVIGGGL